MRDRLPITALATDYVRKTPASLGAGPGETCPANAAPANAASLRNAEITKQMEALARLVAIARHDTGQSSRVANFLLAWWNADRDGGFNLTDLWNVDQAIADDMIAVFTMVANHRHHADAYGLRAEFEQLVTRWRGRRRRRAVR